MPIPRTSSRLLELVILRAISSSCSRTELPPLAIIDPERPTIQVQFGLKNGYQFRLTLPSGGAEAAVRVGPLACEAHCGMTPTFRRHRRCNGSDKDYPHAFERC